MPFVSYLIAALTGYLLGAIPTGYLAGRAWGVDVRQYGSGRTGGTNVLRAAGPAAALITAIGDVAKGALAVLITRWLLQTDEAQAVAAFTAMVGHNWSIFIGWRGGAGTATATGAMLVLSPQAVLLAAPLPLMLMVATRYASVGSLTAAVTIPFIMLGLVRFTGESIWHLVYALAAAILSVAVHWPNIQRLRAGTERKITERASARKD